ncbi:MAG: TraV family lipoprotein [Syntrophales bacterium]
MRGIPLTVCASLAICLFGIYGCGSIGKAMNPYGDEFACPSYDRGQCVQVESAYRQSMDKKKESSLSRNGSSADTGNSETMYQREVNRKLAGLLKKPNTPLLAPPRVMRVLMLPYKGDLNELYMMRYVFIMADEPRWVIGDYLVEQEE